jgi:hypothetical protein
MFHNRYVLGHAILSPKLQWRHHGIGVMQAYLHEGDHETRVHIWHPHLVLPQFTPENGLVHDHRFGFTSFVMLGAIYDEEWDLEEDNGGEWQVHTTQNARSFREQHGEQYGAHTDINPEDARRYTVRRTGQWHQQGKSYDIEAREFHMTRVQELTVTLVIKTSFVDGYAKIVTKRGSTLINAFDHKETGTQRYIEHASAKLLGEYVSPRGSL